MFFSTYSGYRPLGSHFLVSTKLYRKSWYPRNGEGAPAYCMLVCFRWGSATVLELRNTSTGMSSGEHWEMWCHQLGAQGEMRKDRPTSMAKDLYRIYLDNFDVITKADPETASLIEGQPGLMSLIARQAYSEANLPRHPKKSVCQQSKAEVQGAIVDGNLGIAFPKPPKSRFVC